MARSALRNPEEVTSKAPTPSSISDTATVILFDFDGTLGDTETPAMIVAFWELAPYFPEASVEYLSEERMKTYVRDNAGKAFEFMVDVVEEDRAKAGLPPIEEARSSAAEKQDVLQVVDKARAESGLPPLAETRKLGKDILTLQKDETVDALATLAVPCPGVPETLAALKANGTPFSIATTSGKPRVPVSVVACKFEEYFPPSAIHSGESDFDPPRFKPDPSVYLLAAKETGALPSRCVAVEDSTSGVGSAANAKVGLIVGYVGGSHVALDAKDAHAATLMSGVISDEGSVG
jgi:HAD superfamily hydrolase (TIGR01509 family)